MKERIEAILERAFPNPDDSTWKVSICECGECFELSGYSPEGENIIIDLRGETLSELADDAREAWNCFDADEHAAKILIAKHSSGRDFYAAAPDSLERLLDDAKAIDAMYEKIYYALYDAAREDSQINRRGRKP